MSNHNNGKWKCPTAGLFAITTVMVAAAVSGWANPLGDAVALWNIPDANGAGPQVLINSGSAGSAADLTVTGNLGQGTYRTDGQGNQVASYGGRGNDGVGLFPGETTAGPIATSVVNDGLDFSSDFTLWLRHGQYLSGDNWLMSKTTTGNTQGYALQSQSESYVFYMLRSDGTHDSISIPVTAGTLADVRAYDVTMVWDEDGTGTPVTARNGTLTAYVYDAETGLLVDTQSMAMANMNQTYNDPFYLGNNPLLGGNQDNRGDIERAAAWNRTLTAEEVESLTVGASGGDVFEVTEFDVTDVSALTFTGEVGRIYQLQFAPQIDTSNWLSARWSVVGDGGAVFVFDPNEPSATSTQKLYRMLRLP